MEEVELHPVVELLLARMKSNPEEFSYGKGRWDTALYEASTYGSEEEKRLLLVAGYKLRMDRAHSNMLKELLDPAAEKAGAGLKAVSHISGMGGIAVGVGSGGGAAGYAPSTSNIVGVNLPYPGSQRNLLNEAYQNQLGQLDQLNGYDANREADAQMKRLEINVQQSAFQNLFGKYL